MSPEFRPSSAADDDCSPLGVSGSSGPGQPGWRSGLHEHVDAGSVVLRGQEGPVLLPVWLFRGTRVRILAVRAPGRGCPAPETTVAQDRLWWGAVPKVGAGRWGESAETFPGHGARA